MTLPLFPSFPGVSWPLKAHEFSTLVQDSPVLIDTRIAQSRNPRWHWELVFEVLRDTLTRPEYRQLQGFLLALQGQAGDFLFHDPTDFRVGPALNADSSPNLDAELQVVTDGAGNYYSPIQRNFGGQFAEDVSELDGAIAVYANGALATAGTGAGQYQVLGPYLAVSGASCAGLYLKWGSEPTGPVTAEFDFLFRCRMEGDTQDFEQFVASMWTIGGSESKNGSGYLKFMTSRVPQV